MLERIRVHVRRQLAREHAEDVAVELRGHACRVVIGCDQARRVLHEIGAQQQAVAGCETLREHVQEARALDRRQVSDRAAQHRHQSPAARRKQRQVSFEVPHHGMDGDLGELLSHLGTRCRQHGGINVERHVPPQRSGRLQSSEEQPGLLRGAAA
jgi:hypothetical protein